MRAMSVLLLVLLSAPVGAQAPGASEELPAAIVLKPLFAQRVQILDVAVLSPRGLLVLDRVGVTRYEQDEKLSTETIPAWREVESVSLPARLWPRDARGHLVRGGSGQYDVVLAGTDCVAQLTPLQLTCADARTAWAYGIPNGGLEPGRNYFTTPEGLTLYGGSSFVDGVGALVADREGKLLQLDDNRRAIGDFGAGDDVIPVSVACRGVPAYYLAASHRVGGDVLRAFRIDGGRLVQAAPDYPLPGVFTAMSSVDRRAFVITRLSGADRYDAFQADISCGR
jgi:hypothetical protein